MKGLKKIAVQGCKSVQRNFYTSTLMASVSALVSAPLEVLVLGMDKYVSLDSRLIRWQINYLTFPLTKATRDWSRRKNNLVGEKSFKATMHDAIYPAVYTALINPVVYIVAGEKDAEKIIIPTIVAIGTNVLKHVGGYYLQDWFEGIKKRMNSQNESCSAKENYLENQQRYKKNVRKFAFASIAALTLFYNSMPNQKHPDANECPSRLEETVSEINYDYGSQDFGFFNFFGR